MVHVLLVREIVALVNEGNEIDAVRTMGQLIKLTYG